MIGCSLLSVEGLGDKHVAADGIDVVDTTRGLVGSCSSDAVADAYVLILIWADLRRIRDTSSTQSKNLLFSQSFYSFSAFERKVQIVQEQFVT